MHRPGFGPGLRPKGGSKLKQRRFRTRTTHLAVVALAVGLIAVAAIPALAPAAGEGSSANTVLIRRQGRPALRSAEDDRRRRRTRGAEPDQPETGRPAHLLAGHQGLDPEDAESAPDLLHAETHLHVDRPVARRQRQRPGESEPGRGRPRRLGHPGQHDQEGRLLVHRLRSRIPRSRRRSSAAAGTTIYFMCAIHPWMHGSIEVLPAPVTPTS